MWQWGRLVLLTFPRFPTRRIIARFKVMDGTVIRVAFALEESLADNYDDGAPICNRLTPSSNPEAAIRRHSFETTLPPKLITDRRSAFGACKYVTELMLVST